MREATPPDAVVAVVSKGDPRLLELEQRSGVHFPAEADGRYAGHYPKTSEEALAQLEAQRGAGAQFLCIPATALWWLDHYQGFAAWLNAHCRVAVREVETCIVYDLSTSPIDQAPSAQPAGSADDQVASLLDALLPEGALIFVVGARFERLGVPGRTVARLDSDAASALRRLGALKFDRPTFVLVARDGSAPPLDPGFAGFLERRTQPVARRERLCDLLQLRSSLRNGSRITASETFGEHRRADRDREAKGEVAEKLAERLGRLGLCGADSSDRRDPPITERQS